MKKIRVGVADDHPVVLHGVSELLREHIDIEVCFTVDRIESLIGALTENPVDILLCDYEFEEDTEADGLVLLERVRRLAPETKVLFLSIYSAPHIVIGALEAGAAGFIGKSRADFSNLLTAIRNVANGLLYVPAEMNRTILGTRELTGWGSLSEKEMTVVRFICRGMSVTEIAERLSRSPKTISNQKNSAMKKVGAKNDVELSNIMRDLS